MMVIVLMSKDSQGQGEERTEAGVGALPFSLGVGWILCR